MTEKSVFRYKVDPSHVDFTQRASISSMCDIILEAAGEDAYKRGFGIDVLAERNLGWVLSRMCVELDYMPAEYSEFTLHTWISDYNRLASTRNFTLTDDEGRMFGRAVSQWCMLDLTKRTAVDLRAVAESHNDAIVESPSPAEKPRKVPAPDAEPVLTHRVAYSDIDFNRHVNTMRYIEMMIDMLPVELLMQETPVRFDIHFLRECRYGQTLSVGYEQRGRTALFEIRSDEGTPAVRASIEWK